jgi:hypothetical protein
MGIPEPGVAPKGAFRSALSGGARLIGNLGGQWAPAIGAGLAAGGIASYLRKNQNGDTDWSRALDTGWAAGEAAYLGLGIVAPSISARAYTAFSSKEELGRWAAMAGKKGERAISRTSIGWSVIGAVAGGAITGAGVFGDSQTNETSWKGVAGGALGMGALSGLYHARLNGGIIKHAQKIMAGAAAKL